MTYTQRDRQTRYGNHRCNKRSDNNKKNDKNIKTWKNIYKFVNV